MKKIGAGLNAPTHATAIVEFEHPDLAGGAIICTHA
jgi:hypothetical protein